MLLIKYICINTKLWVCC